MSDEVEDADEDDNKEQEAAAATAAPKGIPEFWLTCLKNYQEGEQVFENDEEALKSLKDIRVAYLADNPVRCDALCHLFHSPLRFLQLLLLQLLLPLHERPSF